MKQRGWPDRRGMGAQSDFISEKFLPSERYKAQQRAMSEAIAAARPEDAIDMSTTKLPPHLIDYQGAKRCSVCKMPFPTDVKPSLSTAFAEHVVKAHRPGQTSKDANEVSCLRHSDFMV